MSGERELIKPAWRAPIRVTGKWTYLYRAVDSAGDTIGFY